MSRANESLEALLDNFVQSGRSESAFTQLVSAAGGLVHGSALRRTGDSSLAEEVAQNVFIILARKAERLGKHTSLGSWLHRTTAFESEKALRKEVRHRKRVEKFAEMRMNDLPNDELSPEALGLLEKSIDRLAEKDRALLLARFFDGKKFREIASERGVSEASCKVRIRRIMDRMAKWLGSRGCALSATALASILFTNMTRACPLALVSQAPRLLKNSPPLTTGFLSKLFLTMKISKMTTVGLLLLLGAVATPFILRSKSEPPDPKPAVGIARSQPIESGPRNRSVKRSNSGQSMESFFASYPYAYERLEELYQKYPNLRRTKLAPPDQQTFLGELKSLFRRARSR